MKILSCAVHLAAIVSTAALAACGSARDEPTAAIGLELVTAVSGRRADADAEVQRQLDRAFLDRLETPFMLAELPARDARATLAVVGQNGQHQTWIAGDGVSVTLLGPLVTGTRGLGFDRLTTDPGGAIPAIGRAAGTTSRVHRHLDGENKVVASRFFCTYAAAGQETIEIVNRLHRVRRVVETCRGPDGAMFRNRYWLGVSDGFAWRSEQWISDEVGYLVLSRLVR